MANSPHLLNGPPLSPPNSRSPSAESDSAKLVEDYRRYVQKLIEQHQAEKSQWAAQKAHYEADMKRAGEMIVMERDLWEKHRGMLVAKTTQAETRAADAEAQLAKLIRNNNIVVSPLHSFRNSTSQPRPAVAGAFSQSMARSSSHDGVTSRIRQESGRNADGAPFYAPAPRNPSRTFDSSESDDLRVDSISAPRESVIRVTSKELTPSDFVRSPLNTTELQSIPENKAPETIDISQIQPDLEGVSIKASAVSPTFAAKVLSPQWSPSKLSPNIKPPARGVAGVSRTSSNASRHNKPDALDVSAPENRRLTMHAGHTPNASISKFPWIDGAEEGPSGDATPRQEHLHRPSMTLGSQSDSNKIDEKPLSDSGSDHDDGDKELTGPLGFTNDAVQNDTFATELIHKLEKLEEIEHKPTTRLSPEVAPPRRKLSTEDEDEDDKDEGPTLRLKPSINFGRPMGSM